MSHARSVAALVVEEGRILLARRGFEGPLARLWEFPGGKREEGEDDEACLRREFREEFGAELRPLKLLAEACFLHKGRDRELAGWLCEIAEGCRLELCEHAELAWVEPAELGGFDLVDSDRLLLPALLDYLSSASKSPSSGLSSGSSG